MKTLKLDNLTCDYVKAEGNKIYYIITPMPLNSKWIHEQSHNSKCSIVVIHGMNWDNDLTPWPAPGVLKTDETFKGNAKEFLSTLQSKVMPKMENELGINIKPERTLIGISLSGLFALWAWMQGDDFINIASISGSFWYNGFVDWLRQIEKPSKTGMIYLSLGDLEGKDTNPRFSTVSICTTEIVDILRQANIKVIFESTQGNHYAPIYPRLNKAFNAIMN